MTFNQMLWFKTMISIIIQDWFKKIVGSFLKTVKSFWQLSNFEKKICFEPEKKGW